MVGRVNLPGNEFYSLNNGQNMTINDVIKRISTEKKIAKEFIACYHNNQLLLPFVKVGDFNAIDVQYSPGVRPSEKRSGPAVQLQLQPQPQPQARIRAIECCVNGTMIQMVVDTGASHSIMYANQVNACGLYGRIDTNRAARVNFTTVQGRQITSLGTIHNVAMNMSGVHSTHHFVVLDGCFSHGLLGMDWLNSNRALIDVGNDCLRIGTGVIPFVDVRRH
jgi:hypothetical protein